MAYISAGNVYIHGVRVLQDAMGFYDEQTFIVFFPFENMNSNST